MPMFAVWYMRPEWFRSGLMGEKPDAANLTATHVHLMEQVAGSLGGLFHNMQGEVWSPNGEARELIQSKGLQHTSMSVGDVAIAPDGSVHLCARIGWEQLKGPDNG